MFEKFAQNVKKSSKSESVELVETVEFVEAVVSSGFRLSYAALTLAARHMGEDSSGQIPAQRGAKLVKSLPTELQPFICRKSGRYGKGVLAQFEHVPEDLRDRDVIVASGVAGAIELFEASREGSSEE